MEEVEMKKKRRDEKRSCVGPMPIAVRLWLLGARVTIFGPFKSRNT
jgi:hypothetical protein